MSRYQKDEIKPDYWSLFTPLCIVVVFLALIFFVLGPSISASNEEFRKNKDYVMNSDCGQLKEIILDYHQNKNRKYIHFITDAKNIYEWMCEK